MSKGRQKPPIVVILYPGRSSAQMARLAADITRAVVTHTVCAGRSVSVAVEAVASEKWTEDAYIPEIRAKADHLIKQPGYNPGA